MQHDIDGSWKRVTLRSCTGGAPATQLKKIFACAISVAMSLERSVGFIGMQHCAKDTLLTFQAYPEKTEKHATSNSLLHIGPDKPHLKIRVVE